MPVKYSELEIQDKAVVTERFAKRFGARQMHVDEWMQAHDPVVDQVTLLLEATDSECLHNYLQSLH